MGGNDLTYTLFSCNILTLNPKHVRNRIEYILICVVISVLLIKISDLLTTLNRKHV